MINPLERLQQTLDECRQLLIIPHNDPDPDAIAAAVGLQYLVNEKFGVRAEIRYRGQLFRIANRSSADDGAFNLAHDRPHRLHGYRRPKCDF